MKDQHMPSSTSSSGIPVRASFVPNPRSHSPGGDSRVARGERAADGGERRHFLPIFDPTFASSDPPPADLAARSFVRRRVPVRDASPSSSAPRSPAHSLLRSVDGSRSFGSLDQALAESVRYVPPRLIELHIPSDLRPKLMHLGVFEGGNIPLTCLVGNRVSAERMTNELRVIAEALARTGANALNDDQKLVLFEYRLVLAKAFERSLQIVKDGTPPVVPEEKTSSKLVRVLRHIGYWILFPTGLLVHGTSGFLGVRELMVTLHASNPVSIVCFVISIIIEAVVFYAFEGDQLREALGISSVLKAGKFIGNDKDFLTTMESVYDLMGAEVVQVHCAHGWEHYDELIGQLNTAVEVRKTMYENPPEVTVWRKACQYILIFLGATTHSVGAYFMMTALVSFAGLTGTAGGWILIALGIGAWLGFYFAMEGRGIIKMVSPGAEDYEKVQEMFGRFMVQSLDEIQSVACVRRAVRERETERRALKEAAACEIVAAQATLGAEIEAIRAESAAVAAAVEVARARDQARDERKSTTSNRDEVAA